MAFVVSGQIQMDATKAKSELVQTKKAVDDVKRSTGELGTQGRQGAQGVQVLGRAADSAARDMRELSAAEQLAARDTVRIGQASSAATGQMGNLVAQFNDLGVMMAAGQNPFQLAIQQGTQITQVIGPMGAAGAAKALGSAFISMLSPINLITIGVIAASAAMVNWLTQAGDEAKSAQDRMDELIASVDRFAKANQAALASVSDLKDAYGGLADEALRALLSLAQSDQAAAAKLLASEQSGLATSFGGFGGPVGDLIGSDAEETLRKLRRELDLTGEGAVQAAAALERLDTAKGPAEIARAANAARDALYGAGAAVDGELMRGLAQLAERAAAFAREMERAEQAARAQTRFPGMEQMQQALADQLSARQKSEVSAQAMLATLQQEVQLQALIAQHGEHSRQVAQFRADAERAVFEEMLASKDVSEEMKDKLRQAFEAAQALAMANMAGPISAAGREAMVLARNLGIAVAAAASLSNLQGSKVYSGRGGDPRAFSEGGSADGTNYQSRLGYKPVEKIIEEMTRMTSRGGVGRGRSGGGSAGAASIDRERQAVERLLAREREALEVLRETDPVKKEMIRNREALKAATDAERAAVEQLIQQRETEKQAIEAAQQSQEFWRESIYDSLEGAILRGEKLTDVLGSVAQALLRAAMMGDGPLGGLFGGQGLLSMVFPALAKKADGGYITGRGGDREDKVPMLASPGEYMVNAAATRRHRHLLEHINAGGDVRGYAAGGLIGRAGPAQPQAGVQAGDLGTLRVALAPGLVAQMEGTAERVAVQVVRAYDREVAPRTIAAHNADPLRIG